MARKIFFSGPKGGSGKTTLAIHFCNFIFFYKKKSVALIGFDIQKELTFLGKGAPYPVYDIHPKKEEDFKGFIDKLPETDYIVFDLPSGISLLTLSFHRYADLIVVPTDSSPLDKFKIKAFEEILLVKGLTIIEKLCLLPNMRIGNEALNKNEDFKALLGFQRIKSIAPLIVHGQALRKLSFVNIENKVFYKYREAFNYITNSKCLQELPDKIKQE